MLKDNSQKYISATDTRLNFVWLFDGVIFGAKISSGGKLAKLI